MLSTSISRLSFVGMVVVSWISIVLIGGAWVGRMMYDFSVESERLRAAHYADQKALVRAEVEKGVKALNSIRDDGLRDIWDRIRQRGRQAQVITRHLGQNFSPSIEQETIEQAVVAALRPDRSENQGLFTVSSDTIYLIEPFPELIDRRFALEQLSGALANIDGGERQVVLGTADGLEHYTVLLQVMTLKDFSKRVVSGACLELAEEESKRRAINQLETLRFGEDGYLFGGTWQGVSVIGPAKGKNMWDVQDQTGVKIVQRLVAAARNGGGFVTYVMPKLEGRRHTEKVSYSMPVPDWEWYVGAGLYVDDIETLIEQKRSSLEQDILNRAGITLLILCGLSLVVLALSKRFSRTIQSNLHEFTEVWNKASERGDLVDPGRLQFDEFKELATAANQMVADRRTAEFAAKESANSFETLVVNIPGIVYQRSFEDDTKTYFISRPVEDITGFSPVEFTKGGRSLLSLIDPNDTEWVTSMLTDEVKDHNPYSLEYRIQRADGQTRWVFEQGQAQYADDGTPTKLDGVIVDITDRREAEDEHYSYLHFLKTMERIDSDIRRKDDMGDMLFVVMETIRNAFGADRAWLLYPCDPNSDEFTVPVERTDPDYPGAGVLDVGVPTDAETAEVFELALRTSGPVPFDPESGHLVPRSTREQFDVKSQLIAAIYPRIGAPWLMGIHLCRAARTWSSEEKQLFKEAGRRVSDALSGHLIYQELKNSEEKFRTFSEQSMLGIGLLQDDLVKFANKAFCDIFEVSIAEMLALPPKGFAKYVHPDDQEFLMDQARKKQAGESGQVASYAWRAITASGRVRWVEIHSKTVNLSGRPADLVALQDITESRQFKEDLESLVAERTTDLEAKARELEEAYERLTMLDDLKSSFLTTVSHDLRTPLTSVLGYSRLIRRDIEKLIKSDIQGADEVKERVLGNAGVMEGEAHRLGELIGEFMDLTAIKAGTAVWNDTLVEPAGVIQHAANRCASMAAVRPNVEFVLELDESLDPITIDPDRLELVAYALMDNGFKFTAEGSVVVKASNNSKGDFILSVTDTGKGLSMSDSEAAFEPFHQIELGDTLVDDIKGSGLGLTLCRGIVEHYGGSVSVESKLGEGSTFTVYIPVQGTKD